MSTTLVTGAAGFIGFHTAWKLCERGQSVVGFDNLNDYYDVRLKEARLAELHRAFPDRFAFVRGDVSDATALRQLFAERDLPLVIHLAAQAGVRYSLTNPESYIASNLVGFANLLECCRHGEVGHLVYASSSSVYGANTRMPFREQDNVDHPVSLYAATKKSNELMAHSYSHLYGLPTTGLRFFTVYGPWGRPDMAIYKFTEAILAGRPIDLYNRGQMQRDFTYVDDVVEGVLRVAEQPARADESWSGGAPNPATSQAPYRIYNIGNHQSVELGRLVEAIEGALGKTAEKNLLPMQPGDVPATYAEVAALAQAVGYQPSTPIEEGVRRFVDWYRDYHG